MEWPSGHIDVWRRVLKINARTMDVWLHRRISEVFVNTLTQELQKFESVMELRETNRVREGLGV